MSEDEPSAESEAEEWECVVCDRREAGEEPDGAYPPEGWDVTNASRFEGRCREHARGDPSDQELDDRRVEEEF